ncbi:hypothetical protein Ciccas_009519 [Cichlidogyrus casuarinus]|uniref:Ig-like domain-containing protein n=1 Tax=Cichlidogyrus casuarinus TaxID=1844966 RepID=A0ABD2PXS0_9PLAT
MMRLAIMLMMTVTAKERTCPWLEYAELREYFPSDRNQITGEKISMGEASHRCKYENRFGALLGRRVRRNSEPLKSYGQNRLDLQQHDILVLHLQHTNASIDPIVAEKRNKVLTIRIRKASSKPPVRWWINGQNALTPKFDRTAVINQEIFIIWDVDQSDNGSFVQISDSESVLETFQLRVSALSGDGQNSLQFIIPQQLTVTTSPEKRTTAFNLICLFRNHNNGPIQWRWREKQKEHTLSPTGKSTKRFEYAIKNGSRMSKLTIEDLHAPDMGEEEEEFLCGNASARITYERSPEVKWVEVFQTVEISAGSNKSLACIIGDMGRPVASRTWYKDAVPIEGEATVTISHANSEAAGFYQCFIENKHGEQYLIYWVKITGKKPLWMYDCVADFVPRPTKQFEKLLAEEGSRASHMILLSEESTILPCPIEAPEDADQQWLMSETYT